MPIPQLDLSLSSTDNPGSPLYAGKGEFEKMSRFDSALSEHKITIIISDEEVGKVEIALEGNQFLDKIELPTYRMTINDDKTNEEKIFEVTRDTVLLNKMKSKKVSRFSFLGINFFAKKNYTLPSIAFEPFKSDIETYNIAQYRKLKDDYLSFALHQQKKRAFLTAGKIPLHFFKENNLDNLFFIVDHNNGQKFIGDIKYREKMIKTIPKIEVRLIKRKKIAKELFFDKKGTVNKIIYL